MNVSNVSAQDEKRMRMSILPSALSVGTLDPFGYRSLPEVVEDAEHALVVVKQLRSCFGAGFAILLQRLRQAFNAGFGEWS